MNLLQRIRALPIGAEFTIVIVSAFGWFFVRALSEVISRSTQSHINEEHLRFLLIYEPIALFCLLAFLLVRGWTLDSLGLRPSFRDAGVGALLAIAGYGASILALTMFAALSQTVEQSIKQSESLFATGVGMGTIVAVAIINPVFEELFVTGYVVSALKGRATFWTTVGASVVIRLSYHLYQGSAGLIGIAPIGLIFANLYFREGRLWPLIVAHALLDFFGLLATNYR
jgi:uncharacterized protein